MPTVTPLTFLSVPDASTQSTGLVIQTTRSVSDSRCASLDSFDVLYDMENTAHAGQSAQLEIPLGLLSLISLQNVRWACNGALDRLRPVDASS